MKSTELQRKLTGLGAAEAAVAIAEGRVTSEELVEACLERIDESEERIGAWAFVDADHARSQARAADQARRRGDPLGALHGIPVGVDDVIDTADMPTEDGTALHGSRAPRRDATVVSLLRAAGAVILGKTATAELGLGVPGRTRNPRDTERTAGDASSGAAAAVAAEMAPLALGAHTNGAIVRAASYCGIVGYTPTRGLISRRGILRLSRLFDHVGVLARSLGDAALLAQELMAFDVADPDMSPRARPQLAASVSCPPPLPPRFAFVKTPIWEQVAPDSREAFAALVEVLGDHIAEYTLPEQLAKGIELHQLITEADLALNLDTEYERGEAQLSPMLREMIERGARHLAVDYNRALAHIEAFNIALADVWRQSHAIVTPATAREAPRELKSTGRQVCGALWTLCGLPMVSVPSLTGAARMPLGVQLVGPHGDDARLLQCARWLAERVAAAGSQTTRRRASRMHSQWTGER